jgi:hypothetical protein
MHDCSISEVAQSDIPEEFMSEFKALVGDGKAHVSVSADMSIKDFGTGAGAMITVSLTCGQDRDTIEQAIDLAGVVARQYAAEHQKQAEVELNKLIESRKKAQTFG